MTCRRPHLLTTLAVAVSLTVLPSLHGAPTRAEPAARDAREEAARILARFSHEPSVVEVQEAAARFARVNPGAYDSWLAESNYANTLPRRLVGRVRSTNNDDRSARTTNASTGSLSDTVAARDQVQLEVLAEWDLSRLIFNRDGILAARQIERIVNQREDILTTVNKLYFARRQLQAELELESSGSVQRMLQQQLRLEGLTADLDALTGGWFSKEVARRVAKGTGGR
jgi:hypothetical protein